MRVFRTYFFRIATKIQFKELLAKVESYLAQQGLHYEHLLYRLESCEPYSQDPSYREVEEKLCTVKHVIKKFPQLGEMRRVGFPGNANGMSKLYLSNMDEQGYYMDHTCPEDTIRTVSTKIPRPYNFEVAYFLYTGVDFFGRKTPQLPLEDFYDLENISHSGITIHRCFAFPKQVYIKITVDITDGDSALDATPYADAMKKHLGGIPYKTYVRTVLEPEALERYAEITRSIEPLLDAAEEAAKHPTDAYATMTARPEITKGSPWPVEYVLVDKLKALCKATGHRYVTYFDFVYEFEKIDPLGHKIRCLVMRGPLGQRIDFAIDYDGLGFGHQFSFASYRPNNQQEADLYLDALMEALVDFENQYLLPIGQHYPPTPKWYFTK